MMNLFLTFTLALFVSTLVLAALVCLAPRAGLMDHPGERRRLHRESVPRVGGLAIFAGLLASLGVGPSLTAAEGWGLAGAALLVLVGALDDRYQLGPRVRLLAQVGAGLLLTLGGGVVITQLGDLLGNGPLTLGAWAVPFTLVAVVGLINAFNMVDGIDGLAGGIALLAFGSLLLFLPPGSGLALALVATMAALVPYLVCNLDLGPARSKVFLGDAGSLLLGYLLVWGLIVASQAPGGLAPVTALWLVAIPLMDTLAVMGRRLSQGRHPFSADRGHLHHYLARLLRSTRGALFLLLALASLLAGIGLAGQVWGWPEAVRFYLALACFGGYLAILNRWPAWHRRRLKRRREGAAPAVAALPAAGGERGVK